MARPSSKTDLLEAASSQYEQLQNLMATRKKKPIGPEIRISEMSSFTFMNGTNSCSNGLLPIKAVRVRPFFPHLITGEPTGR